MNSKSRVRRETTAWVVAVLTVGIVAGGCDDGEGAERLPVPTDPTFASHVGEIVYGNCTSCHRTGGVAPFALESYADAASRAELMARVTSSGQMPPWLPEPGDYAFADERRLTDREIEILRRWARNGAPEGDPAAAPAPPVVATGWSLGEPDLVLEMTEPYRLAPAAHEGGQHTDVFRGFVLPIPLSETRYVRAMEFRPVGGRVVHHATMGVDPTSASRHEDARDPEPGFDGIHNSSTMRQPAGFVLGWTPGATPQWNPDGLTWALEPGMDFVVQAHLMPVDEPVDMRLRIGFYLDDEPAEVPALVKNLYLLGRTIDIPPGEDRYVVDDSYVVPVDVEVLGLYPHAHYLARTMEVETTLPGGREQTLLRIDEWDFDWQQVYQFEDPVTLAAGTEIRMRYVYDNSADNPRNPHDPPMRVTYGLRSANEMAELWIQARPSRPDDLPALQQSVDRKRAEDYFELFQHLVRVDPADPVAHTDLGAVLGSQGRVDEAIRHYQIALELRADFAQAHFELALLLEAKGDVEQALRHLTMGVDLFPAHAAAHVALGRIRFAQDRLPDAAAHAGRAVEIDARDAAAHVLLANIAKRRGSQAEAVTHYRNAVRAAPGNAGLHYDLATNLILAGEAEEALEHLRNGADLMPENLSPRLVAGWMLASHPDEIVRAPRFAMEIAADLEAGLGARHPIALDLLAAAHASEGDFERAWLFAREASDAASATGQPDLARWIQRRLVLYGERRAFLSADGPYSEAGFR